jgi:hypothetical protein
MEEIFAKIGSRFDFDWSRAAHEGLMEVELAFEIKVFFVIVHMYLFCFVKVWFLVYT